MRPRRPGTAHTPVRVQRTGARRSRPGNGAALGRIRCAVRPGLSVCLPEGATGSQRSNPGTQGPEDRTAVMSHAQMSRTPRRVVPTVDLLEAPAGPTLRAATRYHP